MSSQLKFFGHILRFEKDKPADIYTLQKMIMMISGMPGKSDGGQNANGVGQGICLFSLFSRTKRTMLLISWVRKGNNSIQISLLRIVKRKEISSMLLKNCWSRKGNFFRPFKDWLQLANEMRDLLKRSVIFTWNWFKWRRSCPAGTPFPLQIIVGLLLLCKHICNLHIAKYEACISARKENAHGLSYPNTSCCVLPRGVTCRSIFNVWSLCWWTGSTCRKRITGPSLIFIMFLFKDKGLYLIKVVNVCFWAASILFYSHHIVLDTVLKRLC